jgi:hypothetical protein
MEKQEIIDSEYLYNIIKVSFEKKLPLVLAKIGCNELNFLYTMETNIHRDVYTFNITRQAGAYPDDYEYLVSFMKEHYLPYLKEVDVFAKWNHNEQFEAKFITTPFNKNIKLRSFEPFYFETKRWTEHLKDKKVLVVSPFSDSIKKQYKKKQFIHNNLLPDFELKCLNFPLSYYLQHETLRVSYPENSHKLLELFKNKINEIDFDIALIGAGIYSLPLAVHCKSLGKISVHLGGGLQTIFGVKGNRWKGQNFINEYWVSPSKEETPFYADLCESGCYWM